MFTPKQEMAHTDIGVETHQSAMTGPDWAGDAARVMSGSEASVEQRMSQAHQIMFGATAGFPPDQVNGVSGPFFADLSNAPSSMWEWDAGLAVAEQPGEP